MLWLGHIVSVNSIFVDTGNLHRLTLQQKEEKREKKIMFLSEWREITGSTMTGRTIVNKRQKRTLRWIATHLVTKNLIKSRLHLVTRVRWWLNTPVTAGCQQNSITFNTWQFYPLFLQWQRKYYEEGIFFFFSRGAPEENTNPSCNTKKKLWHIQNSYELYGRPTLEQLQLAAYNTAYPTRTRLVRRY